MKRPKRILVSSLAGLALAIGPSFWLRPAAAEIDLTGTISLSQTDSPSHTGKVDGGVGNPPEVQEGSDLFVTPPVEGSLGGAEAAAVKPPAPYKTLYYDNDFGDPGGLVINGGGEFRLRQHNENNLRGSNLSGLDDNFLLMRTRMFVNAQVSDYFRFYGEAIDANSSWEDFAPRTIEENNWDALNLFGDLKLWETCAGQTWGRVGRQELLYGEQRLVSPLDWSNTRRTFDGGKLFYQSDAWNVDGFWTRPVPFAQHVNNDSNFDHPDQSQEFMGLYATKKGEPGHSIDLYALRLDEQDGPGTAFFPVNYDANTLGARWAARSGNWLLEMEGGYQFGEFGAEDASAGFYTIGLGHEWSSSSYKPKVWMYYDWASGDEDPFDDEHNTFNQLFPLGHKYFGYADLVARQNIQDLNFLAGVSPTANWNLLVWHHIFHLDESRDALYNAAGAPIRIDTTGASGTDVGQELDLTAQYVIGPMSDLLFGYSHFWSGDFVDNTTGPGIATNIDFFYTQYSVRF